MREVPPLRVDMIFSEAQGDKCGEPVQTYSHPICVVRSNYSPLTVPLRRPSTMYFRVCKETIMVLECERRGVLGTGSGRGRGLGQDPDREH